MSAPSLPTTIFKFRLIGTTTVFEATNEFLAAGFIESVRGVNTRLGVQTCARLEDIIVFSRRPEAVIL